MKRLSVDPFGNVGEKPKCPYCGATLGWWAVANMKHTRECLANPENVKKIQELADALANKQSHTEKE